MKNENKKVAPVVDVEAIGSEMDVEFFGVIIPAIRTYDSALPLKMQIQAVEGNVKAQKDAAKARIKTLAIALEAIALHLFAYFANEVTAAEADGVHSVTTGKGDKLQVALPLQLAYAGSLARRVAGLASGLRLTDKTSYAQAIADAKLGHVFAFVFDSENFTGNCELRANITDKHNKLDTFCSTLYGTGKAVYMKNAKDASKSATALREIVGKNLPEASLATLIECATLGFWFIDAKSVIDGLKAKAEAEASARAEAIKVATEAAEDAKPTINAVIVDARTEALEADTEASDALTRLKARKPRAMSAAA